MTERIKPIKPKDHICYLIENVINQLDYEEFDKKVQGAGNPRSRPTIKFRKHRNF